MEGMGLKIKNYRKRKPMTQACLAERLEVDRRTVINWESGETEPSGEMVVKISNILNIPVDLILGAKPSETKVPVFGKVVAGIPLEAIEEIIDYEEIPSCWSAGHEYFALKVVGDSMQPRMYDGDVVIVSKQNDVESGDIAIVLVNGADATIKKISKSPLGIILQPLNYAYEQKLYSNEEIERLPITILGRVIELRAKY
jgi:repressor LexA